MDAPIISGAKCAAGYETSDDRWPRRTLNSEGTTIKPFRIMLGLVLCLAAAGGGLSAEVPAPAPAPTPAPAPAPAPTPAPAIAPAPAPVAPKVPARKVILSSLPGTPGVYGGRVEYSEQAFPILADHTETEVQGMLRVAEPQTCHTCRATGKITKKISWLPPSSGGTFRTPVVKTWEETCDDCGGFGNEYDAKFGQRLLNVVDTLAHTVRGDMFMAMRTAAEARLRAVFEVRDRSWTTYKIKEVMGYTTVGRYVDYWGVSHPIERYGVAGIDLETDQNRTFHQEVATLVAPVWTTVKDRLPQGQPVLVIGNTSERSECGGWVWMKMDADAYSRQPSSRAIILCGTPSTSAVPQGHVVLGGLLVGKWYDPSVPADVAPGTPVAPGQTLPVVMAVVAAVGK